MTEKIKVTIEGTTPILFNRFRDVAIEGKSKKRTGAMAESDIEEFDDIQGMARHGMAWPGEAWLGMARHGKESLFILFKNEHFTNKYLNSSSVLFYY